MRTASFTLAVAALAATTSLAVHLDTEPHLEADLDLEQAVHDEQKGPAKEVITEEKRKFNSCNEYCIEQKFIDKWGGDYTKCMKHCTQPMVKPADLFATACERYQGTTVADKKKFDIECKK